jgi:hypothetical protein
VLDDGEEGSEKVEIHRGRLCAGRMTASRSTQ